MIEDYIVKAIKNKDILLVRSSIISEANSNRTNNFNIITQIINEISKRLDEVGIELFEIEDNKYLRTKDKKLWTEDLWTEVKVELGYNFSKEKFNYLTSIMEYLRESGHPDFKLESKQDSVINRVENRTRKGLAIASIVAGIVIIGGIIISIINKV